MSAFEIPSILTSLRNDIEEGHITIRQAAVELCEAGWMNFVDEERAWGLLFGRR